MEPEPTLAEAARILRPGGIFAAYDYDWPPIVHWQVEAAFEELQRRVARARAVDLALQVRADGHGCQPTQREQGEDERQAARSIRHGGAGR
jgi:SAM-dependent methyltransferase